MAAYTSIAAWEAAQSVGGGATLVFEVADFTGLGDLIAESSVVLDGRTWTITNAAANVNVLASSGDDLHFQSKVSSGAGNIYAYQTYRTSGYMHCAMDLIDPDGDDDDGYEMQVVLADYPAGNTNEVAFLGFNATAGNTGRDVLCGMKWDGARKVLINDGSNEGATVAETGTARDFRVRCSGVAYGGVGEVRRAVTPTAAAGNGDPLFVGITTDASSIDANGSAVNATRGCKRSVTSAVFAAYGPGIGNGTLWKIDAIRIWRLARQVV